MMLSEHRSRNFQKLKKILNDEFDTELKDTCTVEELINQIRYMLTGYIRLQNAKNGEVSDEFPALSKIAFLLWKSSLKTDLSSFSDLDTIVQTLEQAIDERINIRMRDDNEH